MTKPLDWIDALELPKAYANDDAYSPYQLRAFARTVVAEYIARQEVVAWQYQCLNQEPWSNVVPRFVGQTIEVRLLELHSDITCDGEPAYEVRALCVKETK